MVGPYIDRSAGRDLSHGRVPLNRRGVTRLSRVARSVRYLSEVVAKFEHHSVDLVVVLKQGLDTSLPAGPAAVPVPVQSLQADDHIGVAPPLVTPVRRWGGDPGLVMPRSLRGPPQVGLPDW